MNKEEAIELIKSNFSHFPELMEELLADIEIPRDRYRKWCTYEYHSNDSWFLRELLYKKVTVGEKIRINSPGWQYHGYEAVVEKKFKFQVHCYVPGKANVRLRINPSSVVLIPQEKKEVWDVNVGDLVCIDEARFRPRYEEDALFKVVWKGSKYVRVEPRFPKYPVINVNVSEKRIGDRVRESGEPGRYWNEGVYNLDIPLTSLKKPNEFYSKEDVETVQDLDTLGF
jgi:hypothetical protein